MVARLQYAAACWGAVAVALAMRMLHLVVGLAVQGFAVRACLGNIWTGVLAVRRRSTLCLFALAGDLGRFDFAWGTCSGIVLPGGRLVRMRSTSYLLGRVGARSCWSSSMVEASPRRCGACYRRGFGDRTLPRLRRCIVVRCCWASTYACCFSLLCCWLRSVLP